MLSLRRQNTKRQRLAWAAAIYVVTTLVYFAVAAPATLSAHTRWNHFALLAESWLGGHLHLPGPPPAYSGNNDFALFAGRWYVVFPPFPALLLTPLVYLGGSAANVQDGQFFLWLAGLGPALLLLVLEKCQRLGFSGRSLLEHAGLALLFAFGSVYFFSAEQGTVWYAAHVVAVVLVAAFLLLALDAEFPALAGVTLGCALLTRPPVFFAGVFFLLEAWRVSLRALPAAPTTQSASAWASVRACVQRVDGRRLLPLLVRFLIPLTLLGAVALIHNWLRFGDPFESGYRYLQVVWRGRIEKWGLFDYHYLAKNLGVVLSSLPWYDPVQRPHLRINTHGLALWVTTPAYLWLLWPGRVKALTARVRSGLYVTAALIAVPTLFYQNTGWAQFGYRFSNDYALLLIVLLALLGRRLGVGFWTAAALAVAVNAFGAATFDRTKFSAYYYADSTQRTLYQPD